MQGIKNAGPRLARRGGAQAKPWHQTVDLDTEDGNGPLELPQRHSLVEQLLEILRRKIQRGEWLDRLPSERRLSEELQVSRPTLRAALATLQREKLIRVAHGKKSLICVPSKAIVHHPKSRRIGALVMQPLLMLSHQNVLLFREIQRHVQAAGYQLELHADSRFRGQHPDRFLKSLMQQSRAASWLLLASTSEVQRWFMERKIPALVAGSAHIGINLPSYDVDYRGLARHAAQTFLRMGHRYAVFITPKTDLAGDLASEHGFQEAFPPRRPEDGLPLVVHHDGTVEEIQRLLDRLLNSRTVPTAMLVARPSHVLTVFSYLLRKGIRIPDGIALIARDDEEFLAHISPSIARYVFNEDVYHRRLSKSLLELARTGTLKPRQTVIPSLQKGETLAPPKGHSNPNFSPPGKNW